MRGQSLIELVIAIGIFVILIPILISFVLNSYVFGRLSSEVTKEIKNNLGARLNKWPEEAKRAWFRVFETEPPTPTRRVDDGKNEEDLAVG